MKIHSVNRYSSSLNSWVQITDNFLYKMKSNMRRIYPWYELKIDVLQAVSPPKNFKFDFEAVYKTDISNQSGIMESVALYSCTNQMQESSEKYISSPKLGDGGTKEILQTAFNSWASKCNRTIQTYIKITVELGAYLKRDNLTSWVLMRKFTNLPPVLCKKYFQGLTQQVRSSDSHHWPR